MSSPDFAAAYTKMLQADTAYSNALTAAYGRQAGDMRYRTKDLPPEIAELGRAYVAAADAWRAASHPKPVGAAARS
jgi:hypothetical protein